MLKKKIVIKLFLCFGLFLFSSSNSYSAEGTFTGTPGVQQEGTTSHAVLSLSPPSKSGDLFLGNLSKASEDFIKCFDEGLYKGKIVVITGKFEPYFSPYYSK